MINRDQYLKDKKKSFKAVDGGEDDSYNKKLTIHKLKNVMILVLVIVVVLFVVGINIVKEKTKVYTDYEIRNLITDENASDNQLFSYKNGVVELSRDGISYIEGNQVIWNYAFELKNPVYDVCGDYIAVGDTLSTNVYVFNQSGYKYDTNVLGYPTQLLVVSSGCVIVSVEDGTTNYIYMYSQSGQIYKIKTDLSGGGYPLDICASSDGEKLVVSYIYINEEQMMSKVVFYNFSGVGQNEGERAVGAWHYENTIIPEVEFLDNDTVALIGDNLLSVYEYKQIPENIYEISIDREIKRVFVDQGYIGLVYNVADSSNGREIEIYTKKNSTPVLEYSYNTDYTDFFIADDYIMMYNSSSCNMINFNGTSKFGYEFSSVIYSMTELKGHNEFYISTDGYIQQIRLK